MTHKNITLSRFSRVFRTFCITAGLFTAAVFLLLSASCSSEQHLSIREDGSGRGRIVVDLHPMFIQYLKDVSAGFIEGDMKDERFSAFDINKINATMEELEGISLVSAFTEGEGTLDLAFVFSHPEAILPAAADGRSSTGGAAGAGGASGVAGAGASGVAGAGGAAGAGSSTGSRVSSGSGSEGVVEFSSNGNERTLAVRIDSENFSRFFPLIGIEEQEALMSFGPQQDPYTESEYIEMMQYALGDYENASTIRRVLSRRESTLKVEVDGKITDVKGFTLDGNTAVAVIPFLRAATLREPLEFVITWQPE